MRVKSHETICTNKMITILSYLMYNGILCYLKYMEHCFWYLRRIWAIARSFFRTTDSWFNLKGTKVKMAVNKCKNIHYCLNFLI